MVSLTIVLLLSFVFQLPFCHSSVDQEELQGRYNASLSNSFLFMEAQRSGKLPADQRIKWRGDSAMKDIAPTGASLAGGYYIGGGYIKYTQPLAFAMAQLGWSLLEFSEEYKKNLQLTIAMKALRRGLEYLVDAHCEPDKLVIQIGDSSYDSRYYGPPETMNVQRPVYAIDKTKPGTDIAASVAAALAIGSLVFKNDNKPFSSICLQHAEELLDFANTYRGIAVDGTALPASEREFFHSASYSDDLLWASAWLLLATNDDKYVRLANRVMSDAQNEGQYNPYYNWDNTYYGALEVLNYIDLDNGKQTSQPFYEQQLQLLFLWWMKGNKDFEINITREGFSCGSAQGANRNTAGISFLALIHARRSGEKYGNILRCWAQKQIDYILGDNPRGFSYVVGVGEKYPTEPHHKAAACNATAGICNLKSFRANTSNPHVLFGAMVTGSCRSEFTSDRTDIETNAVELDGNSVLTGCLSAIVDKRNQCNESLPTQLSPGESFIGVGSGLDDDDEDPYNGPDQLNIPGDQETVDATLPDANKTTTGNATIMIPGFFTVNATIPGNGTISGNATIPGNATISGNGTMTGNETTGGNGTMTGNETISGNGTMTGNETTGGNSTATVDGGLPSPVGDDRGGSVVINGTKDDGTAGGRNETSTGRNETSSGRNETASGDRERGRDASDDRNATRTDGRRDGSHDRNATPTDQVPAGRRDNGERGSESQRGDRNSTDIDADAFRIRRPGAANTTSTSLVNSTKIEKAKAMTVESKRESVITDREIAGQKLDLSGDEPYEDNPYQETVDNRKEQQDYLEYLADTDQYGLNDPPAPPFLPPVVGIPEETGDIQSAG